MSTIVIVAIIVIIALIVLFAVVMPRSRAKAREREIIRRRDEVASAHRERAEDRSARADYAEQQAARERAEASLDPSAWLIRVMERLGLVWDVVRITPERQAQKLAGTELAPQRIAA